MKNNKNYDLHNKNLIYGAIIAIFGLLLCIFRTKFVESAIITAGIIITLFGVLEIIKGLIPFGIIKLAIGISLIVLGSTVINVAFFVGGFILIFMGVLRLSFAWNLQKHTDNIIRKIHCFVSPILTIACGVLFISLKFSLASIICLILGIILIINGISLMFEKEI